MDNLTIGYVSGMIAAGIAIAQFVVPNALALILVATLTDRHSAVTWSVASRSLSNTHWPFFLRSDQTASQNVSRRVIFITWATPLALLCIAVAAIVTPMGLYETITASQDVAATAFSYVQDRGPLGLGTAPRTGLGLSRSCGRDFFPKVCPGSTGSINITRDDTWINTTSESWEFRLPQDLAQLYQSGLKLQQSTVSSFFDIEARLYNIAFNEDQANATYITDSYRPLGTFILSDKALAVEGLVVDSQNPRIGFRNHTAPVSARYGGEWEEDLLFFEPETQCVDTNITVRTDRVSGSTFPETYYLVDEGGFVNMDMENPWDAMKQFAYQGTQEDPQLGWRAKAVAWTMNAYMAFFFNVTKPFERQAYMNSTPGKLFPVNFSTGELPRNSMNQVHLTTSYYVLTSDIPYARTDPFNGTVTVSNIPQTSWENPFNISQANFTLLPEFCGGVGITILGVANMTNIQVQCSLVFGIAQPLDGEKTLVPRPDSKWVRPVYSCASTTKAVIKTVRSRYNATNNDPEPMNRFEVASIADIAYSSPDAMPLWGVEEANMSLLDVDPLWGIIDPAQADHANLSTVRAEHLYIPAGKNSIRFFGETSEDCMPGVTGPAKAWSRVYGSTSGGTVGVDYSGIGSLGLYTRWDNLTRSAAGASQMLNLIWMDFAANALIGTRGHLSTSQLPPNLQPKPTRMLKRDDEQAGSRTVPVHLYHRVIRYRWVYGIPAFLTALVVALICLGAIVAILVGRASPRRVKHYLWNLSTGRTFTSFLYPGSSHVYSDTKEWIKNVGASEVTLRRSLAQGGTHSPDSVTGAGTDLAAVTTSYQRISQEEPKDGAKDGVREVMPRPAVVAPGGYESGQAVSSDYLVPR